MATNPVPAPSGPDGRHCIFLVHGMGRYGKYEKKNNKDVYVIDTDGWFARAQAELAEICDRIVLPALGSTQKFTTLFSVVPVEYDSIFDGFRRAWAEQGGTLWSPLKKDISKAEAPAEWVVSLSDFFSGAGGDDFGWTHFADVLLYAMPTVQGQVVNRVARTIATELKGRMGGGGGWSVIGHSLGTAVFHDCYPLMIGELGSKASKIAGPRVVCSVSNVSRLLTRHDPDAYLDALNPTGLGGRPMRYIECRHALDFIARLDPFEPPWTSQRYSACTGLKPFYWKASKNDWPNGVKEAAVLPHEFWHYMRQPEVAGELWSSLIGERPSQSTIQSAMEQAMEDQGDQNQAASLDAIVRTALGQAGDKVEGARAIISVLTGFLGR